MIEMDIVDRRKMNRQGKWGWSGGGGDGSDIGATVRNGIDSSIFYYQNSWRACEKKKNQIL